MSKTITELLLEHVRIDQEGDEIFKEIYQYLTERIRRIESTISNYPPLAIIFAEENKKEKESIIHGCESVKVEQQCAICGDDYWAVDDNETELCSYCESRKKYITIELSKSMYECDENVKHIIRDFEL